MKTIRMISEFWTDGDEYLDCIRVVVANNGVTTFHKKYYFDETDDLYRYVTRIVELMAKDLKAKILPPTEQWLSC